MDIIHRPPPRNQHHRSPRPPKFALLIVMLAATAIAQTEKIEFQMLPIPSNLNVSESRSSAVIRSARDWNIWVSNLPDIPENLPTIDFEHYTLLVANAGYKANGPYDVKFDSVTDAGNAIIVHVSVTGPVSCPAQPQAAHYVAMAVIPRTDKPIQFNVSTGNSACRRTP
jgi:hypothetical protein